MLSASRRKRALLRTEEYQEYIGDEESPPFRILWYIVPALFLKIFHEEDFKLEKSYLTELVQETKRLETNPESMHIFYDKVLSEVWVEEFPKILERHRHKLSDIRIEIGQNIDIDNNFLETFREDSIFCQSELPIFLKLIIESNEQIKVEDLFYMRSCTNEIEKTIKRDQISKVFK